MKLYGSLACRYRVGKTNEMDIIAKLSAQSTSEEQEALLRQKAMLIIVKKGSTSYVWNRVIKRLIKCINNMGDENEKRGT